MMTRNQFLKLSSTVAATATISSLLTGCGGSKVTAPTGFTMSGDGSYSFTGSKSASRYEIWVFATKYAPADDKPTTNDVPDVMQVVAAGDSTAVSGTVDGMSSVPFGMYKAYVCAYNKDGEATEFVSGGEFCRGGDLPVPTITVERNYWGCKVTVSDIADRQKTSGIYGFAAELYSDEACTQLVDSAEFGYEITSNPDAGFGPDANQYNGNTCEFAVPEVTDPALMGEDGFLVEPVVYYARCKALGDTEAEAVESDWCEPVSVEINGDKKEERGFFFPG